jgi:predicted nuclease of predicted toxin-antitoxin system
MKIKLDENLPLRLAAALKLLEHDVHTVLEEGLTGHADMDIWQVTQNERRFLITQDLDFSDARQFLPGTHSGILLVRLNSPDRQSLLDRVQDVFRTEAVHQWRGCLVVVTDHKVRVLRPSNN